MVRPNIVFRRDCAYTQSYVCVCVMLKQLVTQIEYCSLINYKYKLKRINYKARNMKVEKTNAQNCEMVLW